MIKDYNSYISWIDRFDLWIFFYHLASRKTMKCAKKTELHFGYIDLYLWDLPNFSSKTNSEGNKNWPEFRKLFVTTLIGAKRQKRAGN